MHSGRKQDHGRWESRADGDGGSGSGSSRGRVEEILALCPEYMGLASGKYDTISDNDRRLKARAIGRIKALLSQVKENIKVGSTRKHCVLCVMCQFADSGRC